MAPQRIDIYLVLLGVNAASISLIIALSAAFGGGVDGTQLASISTAIVAVTSLAAAVIRAQVTPVDTAAAREIDALFTPVPGVQSRNDNLEGL